MIIIHVNRNFLNDPDKPHWIIRDGSKIRYAWGFSATNITSSKSDSKQLACGARAYLIAESIIIYDKEGKVFKGLTFKQAKEEYGN